MLTTELS